MPCCPTLLNSTAISLMNIEKSPGLSIHPCFNPNGQVKNSVFRLLTRTQETTDSYMALRALRKVPDRPALTSDSKSDTLWTESNAFCRSTNATYNLPPFLLRHFSTIAERVKMWSAVLYPCLKPACNSMIFSFSSIHSFIRVFNTYV